MNNRNDLAPHEILEIRELMDTNLIGAKKLQASMAMVHDDELKSFMEKCLSNKKENIDTMQSFVKEKMNIQ
ncbi:MAG: hypothetical protein K0R54_4255 [Clostridiaceae bacterium]|jgi:hypothetical protein|nr:hypothetical protein [Clostridiaceae bacterium]